MNQTEDQQTDRTQSILIIDDNPTNLGVIAEYLEDYDFEIMVARSGESGLSKAEFAKPDIILLDVLMPGIDGFETCRRLKANDITRSIPVIFMTALTDVEDKVRGFQAGGVDYITKPIQQAEVLARIKTQLALQDLQRDLQAKNQQLQQEIKERQQAETALKKAHGEISQLNQRLQAENVRLEAELDVARRIQAMLLPTEAELQQIKGLDIAAFMEPASEVAGDYYDVLQFNGRVTIGIGDVTGHGLESGLVMLMTQTAVRTLLTGNETDSARFLSILNRTIHDNVQRMQSRRNLSLTLLDYQDGHLKLSGQHEAVILVHRDGETELIDTIDLGFPIGMIDHIADFVHETTLQLEVGEGVVLYTDGITEARDSQGSLYGLARLCEVVSQHWQQPAEKIKQAVFRDVQHYIGSQKVADDLTFMVIKRK